MAQARILIVDDEFNTRFAIDFTLSNAGYETAQAKDGEDALLLLKERLTARNPFDLVVADIQMPGMTGLQLIDEMRKIGIRLPVLVITGFGDKKTLIELLRRECADYLDKPFLPEELIAGVERVLSNHGKIRHLIENLQDQLMKSEKMCMLGQMTCAIAHEINNPAHVIQGFAELLLTDDALDAKTKARARKIYDAVQLIARLNGRVLQIGRLQETEISEFSPETPIEKAIEFMREAGVLKHCAIIRRYGENLLRIRGDLMQLTQVFLNLIMNASHAMKDALKQTLIVSTGPAPDLNGALLSVQDCGCGIPEGHRKQLFELYFTTRASEGGTGIGLAVVKQIITSHGGKIQVDSAMGKGTTFTVSLPGAAGLPP